jgi:hypothetical protein
MLKAQRRKQFIDVCRDNQVVTSFDFVRRSPFSLTGRNTWLRRRAHLACHFQCIEAMISGTYGTGEGEKLEKKGEMLKAGSLYTHPAKHPHYAWTGNEEAIVQIQYIGPAGIDYINPADDPRNKTQ